MTLEICLVVACNDEDSLARNLAVSELVTSGRVSLHVEKDAPSGSIAYNRGIDATDAPIIIFAHQDVYFPPGWDVALLQAISSLEKTDSNWALLAPFGTSNDAEHVGQVWSTSLGQVVGKAISDPVQVQTFDELVIVMRRASKLRFDEDLPQFHLYGTDIVQTALANGLASYVCKLPVVHNDGFHGQLGSDFAEAYHYVRAKWRAKLPIRTSVLWVTRFGLALQINRLRAWRSMEKRRAIAGDTTMDPRVYSAKCGWEKSCRLPESISSATRTLETPN